jgi:hypothetical protein
VTFGSTTVELAPDGSLGETVTISAGLSLVLQDLVRVEGNLAFSSSLRSYTLDTGEMVEAQTLTLAASGLSAFVGLWDETNDQPQLGLQLTDFNLLMNVANAADGRSWFALTSTVGSAGVVGLDDDQLTLRANAASVALNLAATDGTVIDYGLAPKTVDLGGTTLELDHAGSLGEYINFAADLDIQVGGVLQLSGVLSFEQQLREVTLADGTTLTVNSMTIGASGLNAFAGLNGPATNPDALGLQISGLTFALSYYTDTEGNSWTSLLADADSLAFVGLSAVTMQANSFSVAYSGASSETVPVIDFSLNPITHNIGDSMLTVDFDGSLGEQFFLGGSIELSIGTFFQTQGTLSLSSYAYELALADGTQVQTNVLILTASELNGFAGVIDSKDAANNVGFALEGLDLLIGFFQETEGNRTWTALKAGVDFAGVVGIDTLTASVSDMAIELNTASSGSVADFKDAPLTSPDSESALAFDFDGALGEQLRAVGDVRLGLEGFVEVNGRLAMERFEDTVTLSSGFTVDANILAFSAFDANGFIGVPGEAGEPGMGIAINGVDLAVAIVKPTDASDTRTWTSLTANAAEATITGIPADILSVSAEAVTIELNLASSGNAVVDWSTKPYVFEQLGQQIELNFNGTRGAILEASGTLVVEVARLLFVQGRFTISSETTQVQLADSSSVEVRTFQLEASGLEAFAGVRATEEDGVDRGLTLSAVDFAVRIAKPTDAADSRQWITAKAIMGAVEFTGVAGLEINGSGMSFGYNAVTGAAPGAVIDYNAAPVETGAGTVAPIVFDFDGARGGFFELGGQVAINLFGLVAASGFLGLSRRTETVQLADGTTEDVVFLALQASELNAYAGVGATPTGLNGIGLALQGVDLSILVGQGASGSWTTVAGSVGEAVLQGPGIGDLVESITDIEIAINRSNDGGQVINYAASPITLELAGMNPVEVAIDGALGNVTRLDATVAVNVGGFVTASGRFGIEFSERELVLEDSRVVTTEHVEFIGTGVSGFVGVPANGDSAPFGLRIEDVDLNLVLANEQGTENSWTSLEATVGAIALEFGNLTGMELSASDVRVRLNQSSTDSVVDWTATEANSGLSSAFDFSDRTGAFVEAELDATLNLFDFVQVSGTLFLSKQIRLLEMADGSLKRFDALILSATGVNAFAGIPSSVEGESGTGLEISDMNFGLALLNAADGSTSSPYLAVEAVIGSAGLVGIDILDSVEPLKNITLSINEAPEGAQLINFAERPVSLTSDGALILETELSQGEFINLSADFSATLAGVAGISGRLNLQQVTGYTAELNGSSVTVDGLILGATSVNASLAVSGVPGSADFVGFTLEGASFALALLEESGNAANAYTLAKVEATSGGIAGVDGLEATIRNFAIEVNQSSNGALLSLSANPFVIGGSETGFALDLETAESNYIRSGGELALNLFNFLTIDGAFGFDLTERTLPVAGVGDVAVRTLGISAVDVSGFVGIPASADRAAIGLSLEGMDVAFLLAVSSTDSSQKWLMAEATAASLSVVGVNGLEAQATGASVAVNVGLGTTGVLDLDQSPITIGLGDAEQTLDLAGEDGEQLRASTDMELNLFGLARLSGSFGFEKQSTQVSVVSDTTTAETVDVDVLTLAATDLNLFVGLNEGTDDAVGVELSGVDLGMAFMAETAGTRKWFALDAAAASIAPVGLNGITLSSENVAFIVNRSAFDGTVVDFATTPLEISTGADSVTIAIDGAIGDTLAVRGDATIGVLDFAMTGTIGLTLNTDESGERTLVLLLEGISIDGFSGQGASSPIDVQDASGVFVMLPGGIAGKLTFESELAIGSLEAGAEVSLEINTTEETVDLFTPFGPVVLDAGPYARLALGNLEVNFPGVSFKGDLVLSSESGDIQIIAANEVTLFVGSSNGGTRIGIELTNGKGLIYKQGDTAAASITGQVSLIGVPGIQISTEATISLNGFESALRRSLFVDGESVTLNFENNEVAVDGNTYASVELNNFDLTLFDAFDFRGNMRIIRSGTELMLAGTNINLYVGAPAETFADRTGFVVNNMSFGVLIQTQGEGGIAMQASGTPGFVGPGLNLTVPAGRGSSASFVYNSTGRDVNVDIPIAGQNYELDVSGDVSGVAIRGDLVLDLGGALELSGAYSLGYDNSNGNRLLLGIAGAKAFVGSGEGDDRIGVEAALDNLALVVDLDADGAIALQSSGSAALVGLDGLNVGGTLTASINTTGKAINQVIPVGNAPGESLEATVNFANGDYEFRFGGDLVFQIPGLFRASGSTSIALASGGKVEISLIEAEMELATEDTEFFALSGAAFFSIDPVTGFSLDDFYIDGYSILGLVSSELDVEPLPVVPVIELSDPFDGQLIEYNAFLDRGYVDVRYSVRGEGSVDEASILDSASEFVLFSGGQTYTVNGVPEVLGGGVYRYTFPSTEVAELPMGVFGEWKLIFEEGAVVSSDGTASTRNEQSIFLNRGGVAPHASLVGRADAGLVDIALINGAGYIDIQFQDFSGDGLDAATILDEDPEFILSGTGVGDAGLNGAIGTPIDMGNGLFRYPIIDISRYNDISLFVEGEVTVSFIANSFADNRGNTNGASERVFETVAESPSAASSELALNLGPVSILAPKFGIDGMNFVDGQFVVTLALGAQDAAVDFGSAANVSASGIYGTFDLAIDVFGFLAGEGSIVPTGKWSLGLDTFSLSVNGIIEAEAAGIQIGYDPAYDPTMDIANPRAMETGQTLVEIGSASVTIPSIGITGSIDPFDPDRSGPEPAIPGLVIWENGFRFGNAELMYGPQDGQPIRLGSIFEFDDVRVGISNFELIYGAGLDFDGEIYIATGGATFFPGAPVSARIEDSASGTNAAGISERVDDEAMRAALKFENGVPSGFIFNADSFEVDLGGFVTLFTRDLVIDTTAADNEELLSFASVGARLNLPFGAISGEARNFAFLGDGTFVTKSGFGVFFGGDGLSGSSMGIPSFLPVKISSIGIEWRDIQADPFDFVLVLSAAVTGIEGLPGATFSGAIEGIKIDVKALVEGRFPILDIASIGVSLEGQMFGGEVVGSLIGGIVKIGEDDQIVPATAPSDTPIKDRIFFLGIEGGFSMAGLGGFGIRLALSELGPLGVLITADVPILLDPSGTTGLSMSGFTGGVEFYSSLPDLTDAEQLRDPSLSASGTQSADEWLAAAKQQVLNQYLAAQANPTLGGFFGAFTQPMVLTGSAKIYTMYLSEFTFNAQMEIRISTDGKFLAVGKLNFLGDSLSVSGRLYADISKILEGSGTFLFLATLPDQAQLIEVGGAFSFGFLDPIGVDIVFTETGADIGAVVSEYVTARLVESEFDYVDFTSERLLGFEVSPSTAAKLEESTLTDDEASVRLIAPSGAELFLDSIAGYNAGTLYYTIPESHVIEQGSYTVEILSGVWADDSGAANEASVLTFEVSGPGFTLDTSYAGAGVDVEAFAAGSILTVNYGATAGGTVNVDSILDAAVELLLVVNGNEIALGGVPVQLSASAFSYLLPEGLELGTGEYEVILVAGAITDSNGVSNIRQSANLRVRGATGSVASAASGLVSVSALNTDGFIDITFLPTAGNELNASSILDSTPEFTLDGIAASGVTIDNSGVSLVEGTTYRYPFSGSFTSGNFEVLFVDGAVTDSGGHNSISHSIALEAKASEGALVNPLPITVVDRTFINNQGYLLVSFDDPFGVGLDTTSIADSAPEFVLEGEGAANVFVGGAGQEVVIDGQTYYQYSFTGDFDNGLITVRFLDGAWADVDGNTGVSSVYEFGVNQTNPSFEIRLSGFARLEGLGLLEEPLARIEGELKLTFSSSVDPTTGDVDEVRANLAFTATAALYGLGNLGSTAGSWTLAVGLGDIAQNGLTNDSIRVWGAMKLQSNLSFLENIGITANGAAYVKFNSSSEDIVESLRLEGIKGDSLFTFADNGLSEQFPTLGDTALTPLTSIPEGLLTAFADAGYSNLSDNLQFTTIVAGEQWRIIDIENERRVYFVDKDGSGNLVVSWEYQQIDIVAKSFALGFNGYFDFLDVLTVDGGFDLFVSDSEMSMEVFGTIDTILGTAALSGSLKVLYTEGLYGTLQVGFSAGGGFSTDIFDLTGTFQFEVNTTSTERAIRVLDIDENGQVQGLTDGTIAAKTLRIQAAGTLKLASFIDLEGSALLVIDSNGIEIAIDMKADFGQLGSILFSGAGLLTVTPEEGLVLALNLSGQLTRSLGQNFVISAGASLQFNTSELQSYVGVEAGVIRIGLNGLIRVLSFELAFASTITINGLLFRIDLENLQLNFFNIVTVSLSGFVQSDGQFRLQGTANVTLDFKIASADATMNVDVSNNGFAFSFDGDIRYRHPLYARGTYWEIDRWEWRRVNRFIGYWEAIWVQRTFEVFAPEYRTLSFNGNVGFDTAGANFNVGLDIDGVNLSWGVNWRWDAIRQGNAIPASEQTGRIVMAIAPEQEEELEGVQNVATYTSPVDLQGTDWTLVADGVSLDASLTNTGGVVTVQTSEPGRIIRFGADGSGLAFDATEVGNFADGMTAIVLGNAPEIEFVFPEDENLEIEEGAEIPPPPTELPVAEKVVGWNQTGDGYRILLGATDGSLLLINDPLILNNPGAGGTNEVVGNIEGSADSYLVINGNFNGTTLSGSVNMGGDIRIEDGFRVVNLPRNGDSVVLQSRTGDIVLGGTAGDTIYGTGTGLDHLNLIAAGDILLDATVGGSTRMGDLIATYAGSFTILQAVDVMGDMRTNGTGSTLNIEADLSSGGSIDLNDSIIFTGNRTLTAGTSGNAGNIDLGTLGAGHTLTTDGTLNLSALNGGAITVNSAIDAASGLTGLTITEAGDVTFNEDLVVSGDVVINATGTVRFNGDVRITDGGSLTITGAASVEFDAANGLLSLTGTSVGGSAGNISIAADAIQLPVNAGGIVGSGAVTLQPATVDRATTIGSPVLGTPVSSLDISAAELAQFGASFTGITLGGSGPVYLGAAAGGAVLFPIATTVQGSFITVVDMPVALVAASNLSLSATNGIRIENAIQLSSAASVLSLDSANGIIEQVSTAGSAESLVVPEIFISGSSAVTLTQITADAFGIDYSGTEKVSLTQSIAGGDLTLSNISLTHTLGGELEIITLNGSINLTDNVSTDGATLRLIANGGSVIMTDGTTIDTRAAAGSGSIYLSAEGHVHVSELLSNASVVLAAGINGGTGAIIDNLSSDAANISGDVAVSLVATAGVGSNSASLRTAVTQLSASNVGSGGIFVREQDTLTLGNVYTAVGSGVVANAVNGTIVIRVATGDLTVLEGATVRASGTNRMRLDVEQETSGMVIAGTVTSDAGYLSLVSAGDITVGSTGAITVGSTGTIDVEAMSGGVNLLPGATMVSGSGGMALAAATDLVLGSLLESAGVVSLSSSTGSIRDGDTIGALDIRAIGLILNAATGIGQGSNALELDVVRFNAYTQAGGIYITNSDSLQISAANSSLWRVASDGSLEALGSAASATLQADAGSIVVETTSGGITLGTGITIAVGAGGNLRLAAPQGSVNVETDLSTSGGHLSLFAGNDINIASAVDLSTNGGSLYLESSTGSITLGTDSLLTTGSADIGLVASNNIGLGGRILTTGTVRLEATTGSIRDNRSGSSADITAGSLMLVAGLDIGGGSTINPIETSVNVLSASSGAGLFIDEANGLVIGQVVSAVSRVSQNGGVINESPTELSDLRVTGSGSVVIRLAAGDLILSEGMDGDGNVVVLNNGNALLSTAAGGSISLFADIALAAGHLSLDSAGAISTVGAVTISTTGTGTLDWLAFGSITMSEETDLLSESGDIQLVAGDNILLGGVLRTAGAIALEATTGWIRDADSDGSVDIDADTLRLYAGTGIGRLGAQANTIETTVDRVSARSGVEGIALKESDTLTIGETRAIILNRVSADGTSSIVTVAPQSAIETLTSGTIAIEVSLGDLTVEASVGASIQANGPAVAAGHILLRTLDDRGSILVRGSVFSDRGSISIISGYNLTFENTASVGTSGTGTVDLEAVHGSVEMGIASNVRVYVGDIHIHAANGITLGGRLETRGAVALTSSSGSILDGLRDGGLDVVAKSLLVVAPGSFGQSSNLLELDVQYLEMRASRGVYLTERNMLTLGDASNVSINRVRMNGEVSTSTTAATGAGLLSDRDAELVIDRGDLVLRAGIEVNGELRISVAGALSKAYAGEYAIIADRAALSAATIASAANPLQISVDRVALNIADAAYIHNAGNLEITAVGKLSGIAAGGRVELATTGVLHLAASVNVSSLRMTASGGAITASASIPLAISADAAELVARNGLGSTGAGALDLNVGILSLSSTETGSAYINLHRDTEITAIAMDGPGNLYLRTENSDLSVSGVISLANGTITGSIRGAFDITGEILSSGTIRLVAEQIHAQSARFYSENGDIILRSTGSLTLDTATEVVAPNGEVQTLSREAQEVGMLAAGIRVDIRALGALYFEDSAFYGPRVRLYSFADSLNRQEMGADWFSDATVRQTSVEEKLSHAENIFSGIIFGY